MNARERRKAKRQAEQMAREIAAGVHAREVVEESIVATPPPPPKPPQPVVVVQPPMKQLPIDLVVAVYKLVKKHGEGEIVVRHDGDVLTLSVGDAVARPRMTQYAQSGEVKWVGQNEALPLDSYPPRRGNADRFVSHSKLPLDYEPPETSESPAEVVPLAQPNGMPRAPRDRTRAQRAALAIHDKEGNVAQVLSPEAIARA